MSLAILKYNPIGSDAKGVAFQFDIGTNRYYQYSIGKRKMRTQDGFRLMAEPAFTSTVFGPLPERAMGRGEFLTPKDRFDRQNNYIQLTSFRTKRTTGRSVSSILNVPVKVGMGKLPAISFSKKTSMQGKQISKQWMDTRTENVTYSFQESTFSSGMFFSALKKLVPKVLPVIKNLVSKAAPIAVQVGGQVLTEAVKGKAGNGVAGNLLSSVLPMLQGQAGANGNLLASLGPAAAGLLQQAAQGQTGAGGAAGMVASQIGGLLADPNNAQVVSQIANMIAAQQTPQGAAVQAQLAQAASIARDPNFPVYSREQAIPPQVLAALGPLMEKLADPAVLNALGESGSKLINAIGGNSIKMVDTVGNNVQKAIGAGAGLVKDFFGLGDVEILDQNLDEPGDDRLLSEEDKNNTMLLMNMQRQSQTATSQSLGRSKPDRSPFHFPKGMLDFRRIPGIKLMATDLSGVMLNGRPRIVFAQRQDMIIPLSIKTPKTIGRAILKVCLKNAETLEVLLKKTLKLRNVSNGPLSETARFSADELSYLQANEDYLLSIRLIFKSKKGERLGTSLTEVITLMGDYSFDRMEDTRRAIPLNNVQEHRNFWHKVWAGRLTRENNTLEMTGRYYFALEADREVSGRMPADAKFTEDDFGGRIGKLKSGLILSPFVLNALIPMISDYPVLNEAELDAILSPDFIQQFSRKAQFSVRFSVLERTEACLWVYPEVKLQKMILKQAGQISEHGLVKGFEDKEVYFPVPVAIHAIGAVVN